MCSGQVASRAEFQQLSLNLTTYLPELTHKQFLAVLSAHAVIKHMDEKLAAAYIKECRCVRQPLFYTNALEHYNTKY
jgi:hypothetical protein